MRIGIDISQIVYEGTGVAKYVRSMVKALLSADSRNVYVLFGSSLRQRQQYSNFYKSLCVNHRNVQLVVIPLPPTLLEFLWNRLHMIPIEWFVGDVDIFWSSDWTQPPLRKAAGITTVHDLSFIKYPESFNETIREVQKRRLYWVQKICKIVLCDSEATRQDVGKYTGINLAKLKVVYPGFN